MLERNPDHVYCNILIDPLFDSPLLVHHKGTSIWDTNRIDLIYCETTALLSIQLQSAKTYQSPSLYCDDIVQNQFNTGQQYIALNSGLFLVSLCL